MAKKAKAPPPRPMAPGRTAQQPMAQSGQDLMRAIGNLIPMASPMTGDATQQRSETAKKAKRR
jgi:hypothetical protein